MRMLASWWDEARRRLASRTRSINIVQDRNGLPPEELIYVEAKIVQSNLTILAHLARQLAEPEDPPEATSLDRATLGIAEHDFG